MKTDLTDYNVKIDFYLNATLNKICDLFFMDNHDFYLINNGKLAVWIFSIFGTMLVGISGIAPVIIMPHLVQDHIQLG